MNAVAAAVVGTGFGVRVHVPALRAAGFEVRALVGQDMERTRRRAHRLDVPHAVTSLAAALDTGVTAVTVATPPGTHMPLVLEAVAAGRHVLCEKPLALDAVQARSMRDAATAAGVVAMVGNEFRFAPTHAAIRESLAEGLIGAPSLAAVISHTSLFSDATLRMPQWWSDVSQGGGWLMASGSHTLDTLRTWFGGIESVNASLLPLPGAGVDGGYTARLRFHSGVEAAVQETAMSPGPPLSLTRVVGSAGSITLQGGRVTVAAPEQRDLDIAPDADAVTGVSTNPAHRFTHIELGPYTRLARAFLARIVGDCDQQEATRPADFDDGVACMTLLDAMRRSATEDGAVCRLPG